MSGIRVGAVRNSDEDAVYFFGYGVYEGDHVPPDDIGLGIPNPRIKLDSGNTVWGCQCWWGPEDEIRRALGGRKVVEVECPSSQT